MLELADTSEQTVAWGHAGAKGALTGCAKVGIGAGETEVSRDVSERMERDANEWMTEKTKNEEIVEKEKNKVIMVISYFSIKENLFYKMFF